MLPRGSDAGNPEQDPEHAMTGEQQDQQDRGDGGLHAPSLVESQQVRKCQVERRNSQNARPSAPIAASTTSAGHA